MAFMALKGGAIGRMFNDFPASIGYLGFSVVTYAMCLGRLMFVRRFVVYIGHLSYELYLIHMIVYLLVTAFLTTVFGLNSTIFISLLGVLPLAIFLSRYLISAYALFFQHGTR